MEETAQCNAELGKGQQTVIHDDNENSCTFDRLPEVNTFTGKSSNN